MATWRLETFKINALFGLTNAFIDVGLTFCIASCIGQLRWHWFKAKGHRMDWPDIMSNARDAPGALKLFFKKSVLK